jgi:hypothetical protein
MFKSIKDSFNKVKNDVKASLEFTDEILLINKYQTKLELSFEQADELRTYKLDFPVAKEVATFVVYGNVSVSEAVKIVQEDY